VYRVLARMSLILIFAVVIGARGQEAPKGASAKTQEASTQLTHPPIPAEVARQFQRFQSVLQPTAKAWIEQRAHTEAQTICARLGGVEGGDSAAVSRVRGDQREQPT